jgi:hypothetical protein
VIYKLGFGWSAPSSVAEELAMNAVLVAADILKSLKADEGEDVSDVDFDLLRDLAFWDTDFQTLFRPEQDGFHHSEIGRTMGMTNLDRSQWFTMFAGSDVPPHPLTWKSEGKDDA